MSVVLLLGRVYLWRRDRNAVNFSSIKSFKRLIIINWISLFAVFSAKCIYITSTLYRLSMQQIAARCIYPCDLNRPTFDLYRFFKLSVLLP